MTPNARLVLGFALAAGLAALAALLVFVYVPLWGFCTAGDGLVGCPHTAKLDTVLAVDPLAGRVLIAAALVPLAVAALGLTYSRAPRAAVRVLLPAATAALALLLLWALLAQQPALLLLPALVCAILASAFAARRVT